MINLINQPGQTAVLAILIWNRNTPTKVCEGIRRFGSITDSYEIPCLSTLHHKIRHNTLSRENRKQEVERGKFLRRFERKLQVNTTQQSYFMF